MQTIRTLLTLFFVAAVIAAVTTDPTEILIKMGLLPAGEVLNNAFKLAK
jgi:hypothetical protein